MVAKLPGPGNGPASLVLLDIATGRVCADLGPGTTLAVGHGVIVWSEHCRSDDRRPCEVHRRPVAGGATSSYRIPRPPGPSVGALSPDGRRLAFTIQRREPTPRHEQGHPGQPTDIAVLHFGTGLVELVPGIELPAKTSPALAFSGDSRWLAIALGTGFDIRLLAWRTGLALPVESTRVAGPMQGAPALQVLPAADLSPTYDDPLNPTRFRRPRHFRGIAHIDQPAGSGHADSDWNIDGGAAMYARRLHPP
jgi:hypothetical protein